MKRTHWDDVIDRAEKRGYFTETERDACASGLTCSTGERAEYLGVPFYVMSPAINKLSMTFMHQVFNRNFTGARRTHQLVKRWGARWTAAYREKMGWGPGAHA